MEKILVVNALRCYLVPVKRHFSAFLLVLCFYCFVINNNYLFVINVFIVFRFVKEERGLNNKMCEIQEEGTLFC